MRSLNLGVLNFSGLNLGTLLPGFLMLSILLAPTPLRAQGKSTLGQFDFFLLNVVPAAEFCGIADVGPTCTSPPHPWALHGLWPQNNNGTYPVFCAERPGPAAPERNLALTPDLTLLAHEWAKHGTCTTLSPEGFFAAEHRAFAHLRIPSALASSQTIAMKPSALLAAFAAANPQAPPSSLILWCKDGRLTSVSQCLSKDLHPIACQGLQSCPDLQPITLAPPAPSKP